MNKKTILPIGTGILFLIVFSVFVYASLQDGHHAIFLLQDTSFSETTGNYSAMTNGSNVRINTSGGIEGNFASSASGYLIMDTDVWNDINPPEPFTISLWINPNTGGVQDGIMGNWKNDANNAWYLYYNYGGTGKFAMVAKLNASWQSWIASNLAFEGGSWNHLAIVSNGSRVVYYVNCTADIPSNPTATNSFPSALTDWNREYVFDTASAPSEAFDGAISHFYIFDDEKTTAEICVLASDTPDGYYNFGLDNPPSIDAVEYINLSHSQELQINMTATDDLNSSGIFWIEVYDNDGTNMTALFNNGTYTNNTEQNILNISSSYFNDKIGWWNFTINISDLAGNSVQEDYTFNVTNHLTTITLVSPANDSHQNSNISFNMTYGSDEDGDAIVCSLFINGTEYQVNNTYQQEVADSYHYDTGYLYMNYTVPSNASSRSVWNVKHGEDARYNTSFDAGCFNGEVMILRFVASADNSTPECYNGTSWVVTGDDKQDAVTTGAGYLYEASPTRFNDSDYNTYNLYVGGQWNYYGYSYNQAKLFEESVWWDNNTGSLSIENLGLANNASYDWFWSCTDGMNTTNTTPRTMITDDNAPVINYDGLNADNSTVFYIHNSTNNMTFNVSGTDAEGYLYAIEINITGETDGLLYYNDNATDLNRSSFQLNVSLNISSGWPTGQNYSAVVYVQDQHTKKIIVDYDVDKSLKFDVYSGRSIPQLGFNTPSGAELRIILDKVNDKDAEKEINFYDVWKDKDRYKFFYSVNKESKKTLFSKNKFEFIVENNNPLSYRENTGYPAHFIDLVSKHWLDFKVKDDDNAEYQIIRISDYKYKVIVLSVLDSVEFESFGGLNHNIVSRSFGVYDNAVTVVAVEHFSNTTINDFNITSPINDSTATGSIVFNISNTTFTTTINSLDYVSQNETTSIGVNENITINFSLYNTSLINPTFTYEVNASEGSNQTFIMTINTTGIENISTYSSDFVYNDSVYNTTASHNGNNITFTVSFLVPTISNTSLTNESYFFYFNYTLDILSFNSSTNNQSVWALGISNCSESSPNIIFNISIYQEDDVVLLNSTLEAVFSFRTVNGTLYNISMELSGNNTYFICTDYNTTFETDVYMTNTAFEPVGNLSSNGTTFTHRYYNYNASVTAGVQTDVYLYNYNYTAGVSDLRITTRNQEDYTYYENVVASLQRFYASENVWRTVQMDETGDVGLAFFNIQEEDTNYRLVFMDTSNNILSTTEDMKFSCNDAICEITFLLNPYSAISAPSNTSIVWDYSNSSKIISLNWSDNVASTTTIVFMAKKELFTGTTYICNETQTGNSGSINCNTTGYSGEVFVSVSEAHSPEQLTLGVWLDLLTPDIPSVVGAEEGALYTLGIMLTIIGAGLITPAIAVVATIIGLIIVFVLGIFNPISLTFIIIACATGIIIGIKVRK